MIVPLKEISFPFLHVVSPCQSFHYFPAKSPFLMSHSEQCSVLVRSTRSACPAAAGSFQTIPLLCLEWILEEIYLDHLKKTTNIVSAAWESINIAAK